MNGRYRVLYVQRPSGGGTATGLYDMVRVLDQSRFDPVVLFYQENAFCDRFRDLGVQVRILGGKLSARPLPGGVRGVVSGLRDRSSAITQVNRLVRSDWPLARRIARLIRSEAIDLVHNNDNPRGDRASMIAARLAGVPQVSHVRYIPRYFRPIDRCLASFVDHFIYMSAAIEEHYRSEVGIPARKGEVVFDPFDFSSFDRGDSAAHVRAEFGLDDRHQVISNIGRLVPWKGQDVFVRAMSSIVGSFPSAVALIVGSPGPGKAAHAYETEVRKLVTELHLSDHVVFTGFRSDIPQIMSASDIVVHSATEPEPFGRVVVEAMAASRPIVATAAGGVLEILRQHETGLLVPLADQAAMTEAIVGLLGDPGMARRLGQRARYDAMERFDPERFSQAIHRIYDRTLAGRAPVATCR